MLRGCVSADSRANAVLPGETVEGYEILSSIAQGGMGEVFLVRRKRAGGFEKRLAMKMLHPHLADEPGLVSMFHPPQDV